jgi:hypothetical protein
MSALIIGCFIPDLPYFLLIKGHEFYGHTFSGVFFFDLPLGLVVLWLFHSYIKQPSLIFLPDGFRRRLKQGTFSFLPPSRLALIALSILIGTATHILWDAFTHDTYWPYWHWSFLRQPIVLPIGGLSVMYKLLQYLSSVAGAVIVAIWVLHWYRTSKPAEHPIPQPFTRSQRVAIRVILPLIAICFGIFRAHQTVRDLDAIRPDTGFAAVLVVTAISILGLGLLVCGLILRAQKAAGEVS